MSAVIPAGERDFEAAIAGSRPVLVDFSASWCGPCKAMAPALDSFADSRRNGLTVLKVDIDDVPSVASRYSIRSVPTLMLFKDGKQIAQQAGMMGEAQLARFVDEHLPQEERLPVQQDPNRRQIKLDW
jgi:thioredoxin 1